MTRAIVRSPRNRAAGFTLIELMVTAVLVGIVALTALPLVEVTTVKQREVELRQALRTIRSALDAYKAAADAGVLPKAAGESGFPASLELLTQPLETTRGRPATPGAPATLGAPGNSGTAGGSDAPARLVLLRQLPRDPFHPDPATPAAQTWSTRSYASRADDPQPGADVFDVASKSPRTALDGTPYRTW